MIWEQHYEAHDLDMNKAVFDEALADIGENLARRSEAGFSNARLSSRVPCAPGHPLLPADHRR